MCGIAGWVSYAGDIADERSTHSAMTQTMACRGPDASGVWARGHAALCHRRLGVIDLEGGQQPMSAETPTGMVALVYSGECYNFKELRTELSARGHTFYSASDTEVVLRGYLQWGEEVAEHLNGMYAFAIWDEREQKLVLVRDRLGVKPLYYARTPDGVLFGSEPKAIHAHPAVRRRVAADGLREILAFTHRPGWTLWKDMHQVEPGTTVTVTRGGLRTRTYWTLQTLAHEDDHATTLDTVRDLLSDSVQRQLVSDVPLGVLLSGGLDSSAITGIAAAHLRRRGEKLRTFSVDFVGRERDFEPDDMRSTLDAPFVEAMVRRVGSEHGDIRLDPSEMTDPEVRRAVIRSRDSPAGLGDMDSSLYLLFRAIRRESTVALSGEAADELFGGYRWFHNDTARNTETFPWLVQRGVLDRTRGIRPDVLAVLDIEQYAADEYATAVSAVDHLAGSNETERWMRVFSHLHMTRHVRMLLDRKDRTSMAVGLEVRVPFCDHRLVEYVYNAPWALKAFDGREKSLLRHATRDLLPDSVAQRVKAHFPSIQDGRYVAELQQQAKEMLAPADNPAFSLVDRTWLKRVVALDPATIPVQTRHDLDRVLDLHHWFDLYAPQIEIC